MHPLCVLMAFGSKLAPSMDMHIMHCILKSRTRVMPLLSKLIDRVVFKSHGPRVICGDFNQSYDALPQIQVLLNAGFVELQQFAKQKWQRPISNTCKGKSVKDFVWISRELIPHLTDVIVDPTWFADHSLVYGSFSPLTHEHKIPIWRKPKPVEWPITTDNDDDLTHYHTTSAPRRSLRYWQCL